MTELPEGDADRVVVGIVGKPFGVRGACYVRPDPDLSYDFAPGSVLWTSAGWLTVAARHDHGARMVLTFEGAADRGAAEALRGTVLHTDRDAVDLEDDAWWAEDVLGARVVDGAGTVLGTGTALADGPAHDYLVVTRPDGREALVPAVEELVSITPGTVVVATVPGLLDPAEAEEAAPPRELGEAPDAPPGSGPAHPPGSGPAHPPGG